MKMTKTALELKKLEETTRSNKANEEIASKGAIGNLIGGIGKAIGGAAAAGKVFKKSPAPTKIGKVVMKAPKVNDDWWYDTPKGQVPLIASYHGRVNTIQPLYGKNVSMRYGAVARIPDEGPRIAAFRYVDTLGFRSDLLDVMLVKLRSDLRSNNSRVGGYDAADLGQLLIWTTYIHAMMYHIRKAILAARTFNDSQARIGDAIISACGFDFNALRNNLPSVIAFYNQVAQLINSCLKMPKGFNFYKRKTFLPQVLFADDELAFAQAYVFVPAHVYEYDPDNAVVKPDLVYTLSAFPTNMSVILSDINVYVQNALASQDVVEMFADINAGIGIQEENYETLPYIGFDEKLEIVVSEEPLHQIMNACLVPGNIVSRQGASGNSWGSEAFQIQINRAGTATAITKNINVSSNNVNTFLKSVLVPDVDSLTIRQDSNGIIYQGADDTHRYVFWNDYVRMYPSSGATADSQGAIAIDKSGGVIFYNHEDRAIPFTCNYYKNDIDSSDLMVSTRLRPGYIINTGTAPGYSYTNFLQLGVCGTEVLCDAFIYRVSDDMIRANLVTGACDPSVGFVDNVEDYIDTIQDFKYFPMTCTYDKHGDYTYYRLRYQAGNDIDIPYRVMYNLHYNAIRGLFYMELNAQGNFTIKSDFKSIAGSKRSNFKKSKR